MYAAVRVRNFAMALSYDVLSSRKTEMPTAASIIDSSQFPLLLEPLMISAGRRCAAWSRSGPSSAHVPVYVYLMISAARGQEEPAQPVCSGALLLVWSLMIADQASISSMDFFAYRSSRVMYQASALVYAAIASSRSSVQP